MPFSYNHKHLLRSQLGFSLVELMVSIVIGLIILAGAVQVVINSKSTFLAQEDMSYIQENARYALDVISRDVQGAGYWGCAGASPRFAVVAQVDETNADAVEMLGIQGLKGYIDNSVFPTVNANAWTSEALTIAEGAVSVHNAESFVVRFAQGNPMTVANNSDSQLILLGNTDVNVGDYLTVIGDDCERIGVLAVSSVASTSVSGVAGSRVRYDLSKNHSEAIKPVGNLPGSSYIGSAGAAKPIENYGFGATAMKYQTRGYFIEESSVLPGQPALKRKTLTSSGGTKTEEIALGVEDMSLRYGVKNGEATLFSKAEDVTDWNSVVSVELNLLFRSQTLSLTGSETRSFLGNTYSDRYLRQVVVSTVKLRNRI